MEQCINGEREIHSILPSQVNTFLKIVKFFNNQQICQFAPQSHMADGLIDIGTNKFVVTVIAKCYSPTQAKNKFLTKELDKLKCNLLANTNQYYESVLALFMAPSLSNSFQEARGKFYPPGKHFLSKENSLFHQEFFW